VPPLSLYARACTHSLLCARDRGCSAHPAFPAPLFWAETSGKPRTHRAARTRWFVSISHVIACDKREAFAQGSESDEAIHSFFAPRNGLLRGACHRARIRATRWLAMTVWRLAFWLFEIVKRTRPVPGNKPQKVVPDPLSIPGPQKGRRRDTFAGQQGLAGELGCVATSYNRRWK
jgi:hypothetical protein